MCVSRTAFANICPYQLGALPRFRVRRARRRRPTTAGQRCRDTDGAHDERHRFCSLLTAPAPFLLITVKIVIKEATRLSGADHTRRRGGNRTKESDNQIPSQKNRYTSSDLSVLRHLTSVSNSSFIYEHSTSHTY